jgi:prophage regulatory protein
MTERLLRIRDAEHSVGLKKSAIYQMIKDGEFPAPVKIGAASLWSERGVQAWIAKKLENEGGIGMSDQKMAEVERLADVYADHVFSDGLLGRKVPSEHAATAHAALLDYVRGIMAERDTLIADNERLSSLYEQAVKGRADMRSALRGARAAAPQQEPCRIEQPTGWRCTRAGGHEGPCAAVEDRS